MPEHLVDLPRTLRDPSAHFIFRLPEGIPVLSPDRPQQAGKGYVDFIFYPEQKGADAIILELKVNATPEEAIAQIKEKDYALRLRGKIGELPKYTIIFIGSFTNVTLNAYTGAQSVDPELVGCARMLGTSERDIFFRVILPSCTPQIFAGMQVALSTSWMAVLAAEMVGAQEGCGWMIQRGSDTLNITLVMVGMIVIGLVGMLLATLMRTIERRLCSWNIMEN